MGELARRPNIQEELEKKRKKIYSSVSQTAKDMNSGLTLKGRVALVTGAAKRLGRHVAVRLAGEGADIAVHYGKSETEAHALVEEIKRQGRRAAAFSADLTNVQAISCLIAKAAGHFGQLDILINSAANFLRVKFGETTQESWMSPLIPTSGHPSSAHKLRRPTSLNPGKASSSISQTLADYSPGPNFCRTVFQRVG